jgi:hypothetical protein
MALFVYAPRAGVLKRVRALSPIVALAIAAGSLNRPALAQRSTDPVFLQNLSQQFENAYASRRTSVTTTCCGRQIRPATLNAKPDLQLMFMRESGVPTYFVLHN